MSRTWHISALVLAGAFVLVLATACSAILDSTSTPPAPQTGTAIQEPTATRALRVTRAPEATPVPLCPPAELVPPVRRVVLARSVSGANNPVDIVENYPPDQQSFHAVVTLDRPSAATTLGARWYLLQAAGYEPNHLISENEETISVSGNVDMLLRAAGDGWPVGTYCLELYVDGILAFSRTFEVQAEEETVEPVSPIVAVEFAEDVQPNSFAPVNPTRVFPRSAAAIRCFVQIQDAPPDTRFRIRWLAPNGLQPEAELVSDGTRWLVFDLMLSQSAQAYPEGQYRIEIYVDDQVVRAEEFTVE